MKLILRDHFRRWWWVWALGAILQSTFCWFSSTNTPPPKDFFASMFAIFLGPFLLQFDLQRGFAKTLTILPLTTRQIGRAWWLAAVGLPAIALSLLAFLSAGISHLFNPTGNFQSGWLAMNSIVSLLFLGTGFFLIQNFSNTAGVSWWDKLSNAVCGILWGGIIGGWMLISKFVFDSPEKTMWALGIGTIATVVGWFRAKQLVMNRANFRLASQRTKNSRGQYKTPAGFGGLPFLMQTTILRSVLFGFVILGVMTFWMPFISHDSIHVLFHSSIPVQVITSMITAITFPLLFVAMIQIFPIVFQMRFLRTLPISPSVLAATLVFLPVISMAVLCLIIVALTSPVAGAAIVLPVFKSFLMTATLAAVAILLVVSRGLDILTYFLIIFGCVLSSTMSILHGGNFPLWFKITLAIVIIGFSFVLTRRMLTRSSHAYRNPPAMMNAWGGGWR